MMESFADHKVRVTELLDNAVLSRVERLRINASRRFTNRSRGEHLSSKGGHSNEFADYRDYVEGDDIRFVDWNIFARLGRPYLKLYQHEEEMHVVLLIDASSSMLFEGKLERAKQMAAAIGVMGLFGVERVSVYGFGQKDDEPVRLQPCTGRGSMAKLFRFIEGIEGGGDATLEQDVAAMLKTHRGRGVVVVLSDFLTDADLRPTFNRLFSAGLEIFGVQILGPTEIDPQVAGDLRFVDCEDLGVLDVSSAGDLLRLYDEYREAFERALDSMCRQRGGKFVSISSEGSLEKVLFERLRREGWVR